MWVLIYLHGFASKVEVHIANERITSSDDDHQGCEAKVQEKHVEKIICFNLVVHLVIMDI
jgi:predicted esterase YcpF (UPF0227 family)